MEKKTKINVKINFLSLIMKGKIPGACLGSADPEQNTTFNSQSND
jgi:hypothetical protein